MSGLLTTIRLGYWERVNRSLVGTAKAVVYRGILTIKIGGKMSYKEKSLASEVCTLAERSDENLIDLILSGKEKEEPRLDVGVFCPLCQSETISIEETAEGDSERVYFQMRCLDCGCEFVLAEDLINACRRGIENAKNEIDYNNKKIKYFTKKITREFE